MSHWWEWLRVWLQAGSGLRLLLPVKGASSALVLLHISLVSAIRPILLVIHAKAEIQMERQVTGPPPSWGSRMNHWSPHSVDLYLADLPRRTPVRWG